MSTTLNPSNQSIIKEAILPDGTRVKSYQNPKQFNKVSEFVQIKSKDRINLTLKEQANIRATIIKKQHDPYEGTIEWQIRDVVGTIRTLRTQGYLAKVAPVRLFSPQTYFKGQGEGYMHVDWQRTELILHDGTLLTFPYADNNIPYMRSAWQPIVGVTFQDCSTLTNSQIVGMSVGEETNQNLTPKQKEFLLWHWKLGHCHFGWIQRLASESRNGRRKVLETKLQISTAECPYCAACTLSKLQQRKPPGQIGGKPPPEMQIRAGDIQPGDCVSVDQYMSFVPGRLQNTKRKEQSPLKYHGDTIFVDHASSFIFGGGFPPICPGGFLC
jgi:hypothetical protein